MRSRRPSLGLCLLAAVAAMIACSGTAQAAITVTSSGDSGPGTLRQALADAPPGETIDVPAGTYTLTSGPLVVTKSVTIAGQGPASTIVRAGGNFRVIEAEGELDVVVTGLAIRDGTLVGEGIAAGAGIAVSDVNLTLRNVAVTGNLISTSGGDGKPGGIVQGAGVYVQSGALKLIDSTVSNNTASADGGKESPGGIVQAAGVLAIVTPVTITNSTIAGNQARAVGGGGEAPGPGGIVVGVGLYALGGEPVAILGSTIAGNGGNSSGGLGGPGGFTFGPGGITQGAGVLIQGESQATITSSTIAGNAITTSGSPGGIVQGGGLAALTPAPGSVALLSTTIARNRLESFGAAGEGANIYSIGPVTMRNSIVAEGQAAPGAENCSVTEVVSLGFNLESADQCGLGAPGDQVNRDPLLGPLQDNGGPTPTMAPATASPAIDQGAAFGLTLDQPGLTRRVDFPTIPNAPVGGADGTDIGAYELQPANAFTIGKLRKNRRKGTATVTINIQQPSFGVLTISGKGLKPRTAAISTEATVRVRIVTKGGVRRALRKRGRRKVKINATYVPGAGPATTKSRTTKLFLKPKKRKRKR